MLAVKTENLTKKYKDMTAVNSLNLEVEDGEAFALLGVNGAGKTTTIKMLSCLINPNDGDAKIYGHSIKTDRENVKKIINVSPQETAVAPNLSVYENLVLISEIYGMDKKTARVDAEKSIKEFGLEEISKKKAGKLSGGWQRRLSIAMALISKPRLLFLDEPTLGLDVLARRELWTIIEKLKGKMTVILTTHYLEEAEALCDRIAIMSNGHLCAVGSADELKKLANKENFEDAFIELAGKGGVLK